MSKSNLLMPPLASTDAVTLSNTRLSRRGTLMKIVGRSTLMSSSSLAVSPW